MAAHRRPATTGRPSKGDRHAFLTKLSRENGLAERVMLEAEARGMPYGEYIAVLLAQAHGYSAHLPEPVHPIPHQEVLGISA